MLKEQSPTICDLYFCQYIEQTLLSDVCVKRFLELNRVPACCKDDLNFLELRIRMVFYPCKSLEVTYGSVKINLETKINCFAFSEPQKRHFVCKIMKNEQQLVRQNYFRPRHHQLLSWQVPKSERFPSASEDSFKTTFCSFSRVSNIFEQNEWQICLSQPILH